MHASSPSLVVRCLVGTALALALWFLPDGDIERASRQPATPDPTDRGPDQRPGEYFRLQRAYPAHDLPVAAWQKGADQARLARATAARGGATWELAGPTNIGGRITAIGYDARRPQTIYAGAADGGVLKSTDSGATWTPTFDDQPATSIGAIAIHPNDPDRVLVGTGEANGSGDSYPGLGLFESTDGGASWEPRGLTDSRHIGRLAYDTAHPDTIYAAVLGGLFTTSPDRGVYRTFDGGDSWQLVHALTDSTSCVDVVVHPEQTNIVYAAMWERIRRPWGRSVGGPSSGIWRSTDHGTTWSLLSGGLPAPGPSIGRIGLTLSPSDPDVLYAIYADDPGFFDGVYRSTNGGDSWTRANDGALSGMYSSFGWYFGNIRVHPTDPDIVYALGLGIHRSTNGGNSWSTVTGGIHVDQHDLVIDTEDPNVIIAGNDGGIYTSLNAAGNWFKSPNLPISQFYAITVDFQFPERVYGGTQDNSTMRTLTGALDDWEIILGGDGFYTIVDPLDNRYIYAEFQFGGLRRSTNGGSSFVTATNGIPSGDRRNWSTPIVMDPEDTQTLYTGTYRVFKTTNRAQSWSPISPDLTDGPGPGNLTFGTVTTIDVSPVDTQYILAGTDDSNVWITTNGGGSWTNVSASLPNRWCSRVTFDRTDREVAYTTFSGYREDIPTPYVFRTTDAGASWTDITGNLPELPVNDILVDPDDAATLYLANDGGVYASFDLGTSWQALGTGLPGGTVCDIELHQPTRTLIAGTHGRSAWTFDLAATTDAPAPIVSRPMRLEAPAPSPFRRATQLIVHHDGGEARLAVYDVGGRLVALVHDGALARGEHRFDWDGRDVRGDRAPAGIYLVRFEADGVQDTRKVVRNR